MLLLTTLAELKDVSGNGTQGISTANNLIQFLVVAVIFIAVLFLTAVTTKWIARYQKGQFVNRNIEVMEAYHIAGSKYIQLVRIGETYLAVSVGKDTVTLLKEIPKEQIHLMEQGETKAVSFQTLLQKAQGLKSGKDDGTKEE